MDEKTSASKGFGFVEMALAHEGEKAMNALNGHMVDQRKIRVKLSTKA